MKKQLRDELLTEAKAGRLYSWIADNYWRIDFEELADIAKELAFQSDDDCDAYANWIAQQRRDALVKELADRIEEDEEEELQ